jgi:hypothetical protein
VTKEIVIARSQKKLRLTEELARLEFAPARVLRQLISIQSRLTGETF